MISLMVMFIFCHDMKISLENTPYTTKEKFLSNGSNKSELIFYMSQALQNTDVTTVCCGDDADTEIVKHALNFALEGTVEVRAEDADILILLVYHYDDKIHNLLFFTTSKGSFCIDEIVKSLPARIVLIGYFVEVGLIIII